MMIGMILAAALAHATPAAIVRGQTLVSELLRDPDSARFRNVRRAKTVTGEASVCGEVNARNAYGGMVGYRRFYVVGDQAFIVEPTVAVIDVGWDTNCGG